jgi:hypothetical protein
MLSQLFAKRSIPGLLSRRITGARYFALNKDHLKMANQNPAQNDWNNFFSCFPAGDVSGSDVESISLLLRSLSYGCETEEAKQPRELYNAIDKYFKEKFRKLSGEEALSIMLPLAEDPHHNLSMLDDKFWVWETLDEALRPIIDDLPEEKLM